MPDDPVPSNLPPHGAKTLLQAYLDRHGITSARLEREIRMSRQSMTPIRQGRDIRLSTARRILGGVRRIRGEKVRFEEIFDVEPP